MQQAEELGQAGEPVGFDYPVLQKLDELVPPDHLLASVLRPDFRFDDFNGSYDAPQDLVDLLKDKGFVIDDLAERGLLFASVQGVPLHTDERPSALWVLSATAQPENNTGVDLVCGGQSLRMVSNEVVLFDARLKHGVIASVPGVWAVFSVYVRHASQPPSTGWPT